MSEENKATKIYECIGLLSSMVNSGEAHTSKSKEVVEDAKQSVAELQADRQELKSLVKWLFINTNGLDSSFDLSPYFIEHLAKHLQSLDDRLENKI